MLLRLKSEFKDTFANEGKVAIGPTSTLRLFAPGDAFLTAGFEVERHHWHVGITEEYINEGEIRQRLSKGLVCFFNTKGDAINTVTDRGLDLEVTLLQLISIRWQGRNAPVELVPAR